MRIALVGNGQLGSAIIRQLHASEITVLKVPWREATAANVIETGLHDVLQDENSEPVVLVWTAGVGVVGSDESLLTREHELFETALTSLSRYRTGSVACFLASSAGGIYAGHDGTATEQTEASPLSPYGKAKLHLEAELQKWSQSNEADTLAGRITNLYGPGQNLRKPQGFISHLFRSMITQQPMKLSVPSSTIRDFVYTDDVASRIATWCARDSPTKSGHQTKILGSGASVTLSHVTSKASKVARAKPRLLFTQSTDIQPAVVKIRSTNLLDMDQNQPNTPLDSGLWMTWQAIQRNWARGF